MTNTTWRSEFSDIKIQPISCAFEGPDNNFVTVDLRCATHRQMIREILATEEGLEMLKRASRKAKRADASLRRTQDCITMEIVLPQGLPEGQNDASEPLGS